MANRLEVAEIPLGIQGLNGSKNQSIIPITSLIKAENISYESGNITKEGGSSKYNSTVLSGAPSVLMGHDWDHDGASQRMIVVLSDGDIQKDSGAGDFTVTLASGLTVSDIVPHFSEGGREAAANARHLFICTQKNQVQVLDDDGAITGNITTPSADWTGSNFPKFGVNHEGRMWFGMGDIMYYSTVTDHEDIVGGGIVSVYPGEGKVGLLGGISINGGLLVFKDSGIYLIDTRSATISDWKVGKLSDMLGVAGVQAYEKVEDDVIYADQNGDIRSLFSTEKFTNYGSRSLASIDGINELIRSEFNLSQKSKWHMKYYPTKRELHIAATSAGVTVNDQRLVIDLNSTEVLRWRLSKRDTCVSLWLRDNSGVPELVCGDDVGFIYQMDQSSFNKDGSAYTAEFQIPFTDLSYIDKNLSTVRKIGKFLEIEIEESGAFDITADIFWDGNLYDTVTFNISGGDNQLGSFVLDTDKLGSDRIVNRKTRITGSGRRFSVSFKNSVLDQTFSIAKAYLHYKLGNTRI